MNTLRIVAPAPEDGLTMAGPAYPPESDWRSRWWNQRPPVPHGTVSRKQRDTSLAGKARTRPDQDAPKAIPPPDAPIDRLGHSITPKALLARGSGLSTNALKDDGDRGYTAWIHVWARGGLAPPADSRRLEHTP